MNFENIKNHPSYQSLPLTVREVLRVAFTDPEHDILKALREVSPRAARSTQDIQMAGVKAILSHPATQVLTALWMFGIDSDALRGVPNPPSDVHLF
jgi:hypothetical protein